MTDGTGFAAGMYGAGPIKFFELLARWRDEGSLAGLEPLIDTAKGCYARSSEKCVRRQAVFDARSS